MQFGVFDHMDRSAVPLDRFYADRLRLVDEYDRCGFYGYHVAEHHATPLAWRRRLAYGSPRWRNARSNYASAHWCTCCRCTIR